MTYNVKYTDKSKPSILIEPEAIDKTLGVALLGRNKLAYGEDAQENLLHLLESFAAPEDFNNPDTPDLTKTDTGTLSGPIEGHLWFNSSKKTLNYYNGTNWQPILNRDDIGSNRGVISDGGIIPKPVSKITGKVFDYNECVWIVSPYNLPAMIDGFNCTTDDNAVVNMKYKTGDIQVSGIANYMIVGLTGNRSQRVQTLSYSLKSSATGQVLTNNPILSSQCVPLINGDAAGINCSGVTNGCSVGNCAPRTGINFSIILDGGEAPYTVQLVKITRNEATSECISFGYGDDIDKVHTNSAETIANVTLTDLGFNEFGPLSINSDCGSSSVPITGVITLTATDAVGHSRNIYVNYASERLYPSNPVNDSPYNTDVCGDPTASTTNLTTIGRPNYLYVQDILDSAPANKSYYMARTFNMTASGTYTMKIYHQDKAWVYLDGNLVYHGDGIDPCLSEPDTFSFNVNAGSHQLLVQYENIDDMSPGYVVFSIYDPSNNLYYVSNKTGWMALTATSGLTS